MITITVKDTMCPRCGAPEVNPETGLLWIRGFQVNVGDGTGWNSHCLRCHCWFDEACERVTERCRPDCQCFRCYPPVEWAVIDEIGEEVCRFAVDQRDDAHRFCGRNQPRRDLHVALVAVRR